MYQALKVQIGQALSLASRPTRSATERGPSLFKTVFGLPCTLGHPFRAYVLGRSFFPLPLLRRTMLLIASEPSGQMWAATALRPTFSVAEEGPPLGGIFSGSSSPLEPILGPIPLGEARSWAQPSCVLLRRSCFTQEWTAVSLYPGRFIP